MNRLPEWQAVQRTLTLSVGVVMIRAALMGQHTAYVRPSMGRWILLAGLVLAIVSLVQIFSPEADHAHHGPDDGSGSHVDTDGHTHGSPIVTLLLVAPIVALTIIRPGPLASYAAGRLDAAKLTPTATGPLVRDASGRVPLALSDLWIRAKYENGKGLHGTPLRLLGFVAADPLTTPGAPSFELVRFKIACCAADALPIKIRVVGVASVPAIDSWVTVDGTYTSDDGERADPNELPVVTATSVAPTAVPAQPYE